MEALSIFDQVVLVIFVVIIFTPIAYAIGRVVIAILDWLMRRG